jgi:two-component system, LuxR family, sensor kinase FixL
MSPLERFLAYADSHRVQVGMLAVLVALLIAAVDWMIITNLSVGFLYIVPILLVASQLRGWQLLGIAVVCAVLREIFSPDPWGDWAGFRLTIGFAGFVLAGFFVSEINRKRLVVQQHVRNLEGQIRLREAAEHEVRILVETSPLAILILDHTGCVVLANRSARQLLGSDGEPLEGVDVRPLLPILGRILQSPQPSDLRTTLECNAQRKHGEVFLAHIWLSTYTTARGQGLAAVIWDASENLRDREGAGLDSMLATSRVLIGAVSHEIRNLASAAIAAYKELPSQPASERSEPANALGSILQALIRLSTSGLALSSDRPTAVVELSTVLDEARIVIEPGVLEEGGSVVWNVAPGLPLVRADHHGLLQVFLNLARNGQRAISSAPHKELTVEASTERDLVVVRFRDSGAGVSNPDVLFQPFQSGENSVGLGLYISRAILRAHGGELRYENGSRGGCFAVELWPAGGGGRV